MKKIIATLLMVIMAVLPVTATAYAKENPDTKINFKSITGTVKEIKKSDTEKDVTYVLLQTGKDSEACLILNKNTYYINDEEIYIGSKVTGYYDSGLMTIAIYPPQYVALVVYVSNKELNIKVDLFDKNLVSADNTLKLNITDDTKVVKKDGKAFSGDLTNRKLAVFYYSSTKSIPAQTNPVKVVVLSDKIEPDEDKSSYYGWIKGTVTKTAAVKNDKSKTQLTIKDKNGNESIFIVSKDTYRINNENIKAGSSVTGYYDAKAFRAMTYPIQYEAEVLDIERSEYKIKVDYFNNKLTSSDNTLTLSIGKKTEVVYSDGKKYNGKPTNSNLVVLYNKTTKSKPAKTEPVKIVVLKLKKDNASQKDKEYWKTQVETWMKLTDEIIKNWDNLSEYRETLYKYILEILRKQNFSLQDWMSMFGK